MYPRIKNTTRYDFIYDSSSDKKTSNCYLILDKQSNNEIVDVVEYTWDDWKAIGLAGFPYVDHIKLIIRGYNKDFLLYDKEIKDYLNS